MELKLIKVFPKLVDQARFNRTFMELKWMNGNENNENVKRFNRTFMELKWREGTHSGGRAPGFNRTFMELKYIHLF